MRDESPPPLSSPVLALRRSQPRKDGPGSLCMHDPLYQGVEPEGEGRGGPFSQAFAAASEGQSRLYLPIGFRMHPSSKGEASSISNTEGRGPRCGWDHHSSTGYRTMSSHN